MTPVPNSERSRPPRACRVLASRSASGGRAGASTVGAAGPAVDLLRTTRATMTATRTTAAMT